MASGSAIAAGGIAVGGSSEREVFRYANAMFSYYFFLPPNYKYLIEEPRQQIGFLKFRMILVLTVVFHSFLWVSIAVF